MNSARTNSLWQKAFDTLPQKERNLLNVTSVDRLKILNEVKDAALEAQDQCARKQWRIKWNGREVVLRDLAGKLIVLIDQFGSILDLVVQYDPVHAALPWAAFRLILKV